MINRNAIGQDSGFNYTFAMPDNNVLETTFKIIEEKKSGHIRKRKIDSVEGVGFSDTTLKKIPKIVPEIVIPKIAHVIWLSGESAGSAPCQRMLNIISLSKQLNAEGWHVKLWTNKAIVIERALSEIRLTNSSPYRGYQLETGTKIKHQTTDGRGIEICSDKNLFGILESINQKSYKNSCNHNESRNFKEARRYAETCKKYDLPLLFTPRQALNGQSKHNKNGSTFSPPSPPASPDSEFIEDEYSSSGSGLKNTCSFLKVLKAGDNEELLTEIREDSSTANNLVSGLSEETAPSKGVNDNPKVSIKNKPTDPIPFKRNLLDHYLLHSIGQSNYSAKSDYLRMAALLKFGGVYIDSDTEASSVKDPAFRQNKIRFHTLSARHGILLGKGWNTGFSGDLIAAKPDAWQVRHMLMDQFYWSNQLDQLPYVLWARNKKNQWCLRTVQIASKGSILYPGESVIAPGLGDKERLTLRDVSRHKTSFYKRIRHSSPALQKGPGFDCPALRIHEERGSLRYLLTLHSPGPMTVQRMVDSYYRNKEREVMFDKMMKSNASKIKDLKGKTVLSVTKWGELSRVATVSWDQPDERPVRAFEEGEALHLTLSLPDMKTCEW